MIDTTYTVHVDGDKAGERLDRLLATAIPDMSRSRFRSLIEGGLVSIAGLGPVVDPARKSRAGETVQVQVPPQLPVEPEPQPMDLVIVFEDEHVLVVDKPAGLVVHAGAGNPDRTLVNALLAHCPAGLAPAGGPVRPGIVHRLDKDTSGLIVVAKTDLAYFSLVQQFAAHSIEREYRAVVFGNPTPPERRISMAIGRDPRHRQRMAVVSKGGKAAETRVKVLKSWPAGASITACWPETGRTHQIRVHMAAIGHPLVGDVTYARAQKPGICSDILRAAGTALGRQALHATVIGFAHPAEGLMLRFVSNLPSDIKELTAILDTA